MSAAPWTLFCPLNGLTPTPFLPIFPVIIARSAINITVLDPCSCSVTPKPWNSIEFLAVA